MSSRKANAKKGRSAQGGGKRSESRVHWPVPQAPPGAHSAGGGYELSYPEGGPDYLSAAHTVKFVLGPVLAPENVPSLAGPGGLSRRV